MIAYCLLHTISSTPLLFLSHFQYNTILFPLRSVVGAVSKLLVPEFSFPYFLRAHRVKRMNGIVGHVKWMIRCHILPFGCGETVILLLPPKGNSPFECKQINGFSNFAVSNDFDFGPIAACVPMPNYGKREKTMIFGAEKSCVCACSILGNIAN